MARSRSIKQAYYIKAPVERVFKTITDPRALEKWFLLSGRLGPRRGGTWTFTWGEGDTHSGKVLDYVRGERLTLSWPEHPVGGDEALGTTRVAFHLKPREGGTLLEVVHSGFKSGAEWVRLYTMYSAGWAYYLSNLKSVVQNNRDLRSPLDRFF